MYGKTHWADYAKWLLNKISCICSTLKANDIIKFILKGFSYIMLTEKKFAWIPAFCVASDSMNLKKNAVQVRKLNWQT